jgi:hypothetical protein
VIERVRLRLTERIHACVLREPPLQLRPRHRRPGKNRRRVGDDSEEWIGNLVLILQLRAEPEEIRRQLIEGHAAFAIDQVLALAAQVSELNQETTGKLLLNRFRSTAG